MALKRKPKRVVVIIFFKYHLDIYFIQ